MIRPDKRQRDRARSLRKNLTDAERLLWQELRGKQHGETIDYDEKRTTFIEEQGFRVLRFWNNEVFENLEEVLTAVSDAIKHPHPGLPPQTGEGAIDANAPFSLTMKEHVK